VINVSHWYPGNCGVTVLADVRGIDMRRVFASCIGAVVATDTAVGDVRMVEVRRDPGVRRMAVITVVAACNVCRVLANCRIAVMAGETGPDHLGVIHHIGGCERHYVVTVFTNIGGVKMCGVLPGRLGPVMAAKATAGDAGVIEVGG